MKYWILKTEPEDYSFADLAKDKSTTWDHVRNYMARNNLRTMEKDDEVIIYESVSTKAAVGLAKIKKTAYQDPTTKEDWSAVDVAFVKALKNPVTLAQMKADPLLKTISLVKMSRLSVCPISKEAYDKIVKLGS